MRRGRGVTKAEMTPFHFEELELLMAGRWWMEDDVLFFLGIIHGYPYDRWMLYFRNLFESIIPQYDALKPLLVELIQCGIVEWTCRLTVSGVYRHKQELNPNGTKKAKRKKRRRDHDGPDHGSLGATATVPDAEHHGTGCVEGYGTTHATETDVRREYDPLHGCTVETGIGTREIDSDHQGHDGEGRRTVPVADAIG